MSMHIDYSSLEEGRAGFEEYFQHVTQFRRAVDHLIPLMGGEPLLRVCDVSHPSTPDIVHTQVLNTFKDFMTEELSQGRGLDVLRFAGHQPARARKAIQKLFEERFPAEISVAESQILLLYGSSTQWLDIVFRHCIANSLHHDFLRGQPAKQPVVLTPRGSFKCGGYFPSASGGRLHYIPTDISQAYKVNALLLDTEIQRIESSDNQRVVCFVLETPSALGQSYTEEELKSLAKVLEKYPHIFWLQDFYNLGTEHTGITNPSFLKNPGIATQGCTVASFRRDWGGAAAYANVSAMHSLNQAFIKEVQKAVSETYFYTRPPFSKLQSVVTEAIAEAMLSSDFVADNQTYFKKQFAFYQKALKAQNEQINSRLGTQGVSYISSITAEAGQFGFLFFDPSLMKKGGIKNGTVVAELMCLYGNCRVMPTLLAPMGIGTDPVGVRFNICMSKNSDENERIIQETLSRMANFVLAIERGKLSYAPFSTLLPLLREGKKLSMSELKPFMTQLPLE